MLNTVDTVDSNMQWLCNVNTPDLMNAFKPSHSAGNGAFHVGKVHLWAAKVSREMAFPQFMDGTGSVHSTGAKEVPVSLSAETRARRKTHGRLGRRALLKGYRPAQAAWV